MDNLSPLWMKNARPQRKRKKTFSFSSFRKEKVRVIKKLVHIVDKHFLDKLIKDELKKLKFFYVRDIIKIWRICRENI